MDQQEVKNKALTEILVGDVDATASFGLALGCICESQC